MHIFRIIIFACRCVCIHIFVYIHIYSFTYSYPIPIYSLKKYHTNHKTVELCFLSVSIHVLPSETEAVVFLTSCLFIFFCKGIVI